VQLELRGDEGGGELGIGGCTGTGTPNLGRNVVKLLTVLIGDDGTGCGSSIGSNLLMQVSTFIFQSDSDSSV
jgi:hypothetical protein